MSPNNPTIRPARQQDAGAAVALIYSSGPEAFDYIFGGSVPGASVRFLERVFPEGRGLFGCQNHHVAELQGSVVGTIAIYSAAEYNRMSNETLIQIFRHFPFWQWPRVLLRCLASKKWMPPPRRNMDYVANLGVAVSCRSQGIGKALLEFGLDHARERGKSIYALDVAETNPRAEALYERFGFTLTGTQASPAPGQVPGARRLEMDVEMTLDTGP